MDVLKKISIRIVLLAVLLVIMNFVYKYTFFEKDLQKHAAIINQIREIPKDVDILYLGESSNITSRSDDADKRYISAFIADYFPGLTVYDIVKPASHAGIYKILLKRIPAFDSLKTVIVTLNLRSFNAQWIYSPLETPLQKSMVLLRDNPPLVNRFLLSFKAYDIKTEAERMEQVKSMWDNSSLKFPYSCPHKNVTEWDHWMAETGIRDSAGNIDYKKTELACHYIKGYAFQIDTLHNPRIKDFNAIVKLANKRGWNLVFNLMAENTEKAGKLVGKDLVFLMEQNRKLLVDYYERKGVTVVDNLNDVPSDQYIDQNWTTEHYAEKGRKIVAANVANALKKFYPGEYKEPSYTGTNKTVFYNDCDHAVIWSQMQTVTTGKAYSGKRSSVTGKGNKFSISFDYPFDSIPEQNKNRIHVSLMAFASSMDFDAKLIFQAQGNNIEYYWDGIDLDTQIHEAGQWQPLDHIFIIPDRIKKAGLIKIYVYNPSNVNVWIDDFSIKFE